MARDYIRALAEYMNIPGQGFNDERYWDANHKWFSYSEYVDEQFVPVWEIDHPKPLSINGHAYRLRLRNRHR